MEEAIRPSTLYRTDNFTRFELEAFFVEIENKHTSLDSVRKTKCIFIYVLRTPDVINK